MEGVKVEIYMKKGFTLIEVLAILVLMSLLISFIYPRVIDIFSRQEDKVLDTKKNLIYSSVDDYLSENKQQYPPSLDVTYCVSIDLVKNIVTDVDDIIDKEGSYISVRYNKKYEPFYEFVNNTDDCTKVIR